MSLRFKRNIKEKKQISRYFCYYSKHLGYIFTREEKVYIFKIIQYIYSKIKFM